MKTNVTGFRETWKGLQIKHARMDDGKWDYTILSLYRGGSYAYTGGSANTLKEARNDAHDLADEILQRSDLIVPLLLPDGTYGYVEQSEPSQSSQSNEAGPPSVCP